MLLALGFAYSPCFFKKIGQPRQLFHLFLSFQRHIITIFTTNKCEKCPSSIWCRDSNSRPLEHESPPITTRPGLTPKLYVNFVIKLESKWMVCLRGNTHCYAALIYLPMPIKYFFSSILYEGQRTTRVVLKRRHCFVSLGHRPL